MATKASSEKVSILIGLGGNLPSPAGAPAETIAIALQRLLTAGVSIQGQSGFYRTSPYPVADQPDFMNIAAKGETALEASELLRLFKDIEVQLGRQPGERWSARTLDIDLLAYGDQVLPTMREWEEVANHSDPTAFLEEPVVPHPRLHKRAFVLKPLMDVAPDWVHPVLGLSVAQLLENPEVSSQVPSVVKVSAE